MSSKAHGSGRLSGGLVALQLLFTNHLTPASGGAWTCSDLGGGLFLPVLVGRRNGLELDGNDLAGRDEAVWVRTIVGAAPLQNVEIRLNLVDCVTSHGDC